jgi:plastocyanin
MRISSGRLIMAAACCVAVAAVPASIAQATSPGATLSISKTETSTVPVKLTAQPARPADAGVHRARAPRTRRAHRTRAAHHRAPGLTGRVTAHVAGDPGVTIADFHFSPASTTIHVGDTITWSNSGPSSHTATASNGSFNTGILKKGQSASHTFTQPGTYAYVCQIHPFMHGTIVVLASTTSTTTSAATSTPTPTTNTAAAPTATTAAATQTPPTPTLPNTGFNVLAGLSAGLVLLGLGAGLRRTRAR